ncbi:cytochrome c oxidase assembly protein [Aquibacillus koreensis]|uniref:Cytochrome c oxidase assembly protein n=1 Tax=Aquibacillus koreensis TaxID=279446 RepID=A0A9X3WPH4_9BACI|nr:cytochrome c oxidase assembly protein [Aquibacillus koreensis]MCT2537674.1 cytochrome c oxidase assembly protein [Aquibacillus koreensis]MDC3420979.1 cytochrome c oxidase assembly protein [Aquibacillus koreensis]
MITDILANFSFLSQWNAGILLMVLLGTVFYLFLLPSGTNHTVKKTIMFVVGIVLFYIALGSPLNILGRILFRAHIIQMIILYLVVAPLFVISTKSELFAKLITYSYVKKGYLAITRPIFVILFFYGLFIFYHIPVLFDFIRMNYTLNYVYLFVMFIVALLWWSPLFPFTSEVDRLSNTKKLLYIICNLSLFLALSLFFILQNNSLYSIYMDFELLMAAILLCLPAGETIETLPNDFVETLLPFPPLREQRIGGVFLLISQLIWVIPLLVLKRK